MTGTPSSQSQELSGIVMTNSKPLAIITGAGRGIGRAVAIRLTQLGYRLVLVSRTTEQLQETLRLLGTTISNSDAIAVTADVTIASDMQKVVDQAIKFTGRIDVVVNNAGSASLLTVEGTTPAEFDGQIAVNLSGAFYLTHYAWPHLKQSKGVIVNVSSQASRDPLVTPDGTFHAYAAAKAGLNLLTLTLAREGAPLGIRAFSIAPGAVETKALRDIASKDVFPEHLTLSPDDVAQTIEACIAGPLRHASGEVIWMKR